jgi:hypothetical protein
MSAQPQPQHQQSPQSQFPRQSQAPPTYENLKALSMTAGAAVAAATQFLERQNVPGNGGGSSGSSEHSGSSVTPPAVPREPLQSAQSAQSPPITPFTDPLVSFDVGSSPYFMTHHNDDANVSMIPQLGHPTQQHLDPNDIHLQRRPSVPLLYPTSLAGALSQ